MVVVVDDDDRENEGDLVIAASRHARGDQLHGAHARGLICLCLTDERCEQARPAADDAAQRGTRSARRSRSGSRRATA